MNLRKIKTQTLLYVVFALLAVVIVASTVIISLITIQKTTSYQRKGADAYQLAMAGIERAKVGLTADWGDSITDPGWSMDLDGDGLPKREDPNRETVDLGEGEYWVLVEYISDTERRVESHGWVGQAYRVIEVIVSGSPPQPDQIVIPSSVYFDTPEKITNAIENTPRFQADLPTFNSATNEWDDPLDRCLAKWCWPSRTWCLLDPHDSTATRMAICNMLGYEQVYTFTTYGMANCCDNHVYRWTGSNWEGGPTCPGPGWGNNRRTQTLGCDNPLPRCSNNLDDDLDGLIDFPDDPGCDDALDEDEREGGSGGDVTVAPGTWRER